MDSNSGYLDVFPKRGIWEKLSGKFNGHFRISYDQGHAIEIFKLEVIYKNYIIILTESDTKPLKFEMGFTALQNFRLNLNTAGLIEKILIKLGKKTIRAGIENFDHQYLVESDHENLAITFLTPRLAEKILKNKISHLSIAANPKTNISKYNCTVTRKVNTEDAYYQLILLHQEIIDHLIHMKII